MRVLSVDALNMPWVRVVFTTSETQEIDLTPYSSTGPIFELVRADPAFFRAVVVDGGTLAWPNGADIDPDVLYHGGTPPWAQTQARPEEAHS